MSPIRRAPQVLGPPLTGGTGAAMSVALSPDSHALASGRHNGAIQLWDVAEPGTPGRSGSC